MSATLQLKCLTAAQVEQEQRRHVLVLDTRPADQFAAFHIPRSIQIGLMGPFASWAAILINSTQRLLLIAKDEKSALEAHSRLARVGLHNVIGYALADESHWRRVGIELTAMPIRRCEDVWRMLRAGHRLQLIDVRSWAEWLQGHLPGAISRPLLELQSESLNIDLSVPTLLYCQEGHRAMTAASMLLRRKAGDIGVLIEGMEGWQASGLPLEVPECV